MLKRLFRYVIEKKEKLGTRWLKCCKTPDKKTQFTVTDVDEGSEVQFQVRAENEAGVGDPSEPTEILTVENPTSMCSLQTWSALLLINLVPSNFNWSGPLLPFCTLQAFPRLR